MSTTVDIYGVIMTNTALITGASSGIGKALAQYHASKGGDLIITARSKDALDALKAELEAAHNVHVDVIALDLGAPGGAEKLVKKARALGRPIDILINNAGFGGHGVHIERALDDEMNMIDLNVKALVTLCHEIGGDMAKAGQGKILNIGSTAGFMPGPLQAVYFGTKAFVNSFSQALDQELRDRGVTVSLLTPGLVQTGFVERANLEGTSLANNKGATPEEVAEIAYEAMEKGELVIFNSARYKFLLSWVAPFLPRRRVLKMAEKMQAKD